MKKKLDECPVCGSDLRVTEYTCGSCSTKIKGDFVCPAGFDGLDKDILEFIRVFIFAEGSIKQVEKIMNCSYPKVKNLLKKAKTGLGIKEEKQDVSRDVLEMLSKGEISTEEAIKKLT